MLAGGCYSPFPNKDTEAGQGLHGGEVRDLLSIRAAAGTLVPMGGGRKEMLITFR